MKKFNLAFVLLLFVGTLSWSLTMVKSGLIYDYGTGFWGPNGHDGIWHMALIESLARGSWKIPVFAGESIKNYHIGFDLLVAIIHKLTFIPVVNLYFQVIPPILALSIGYFAYKFVYYWKKSKTQAWWATFFVYFGGNWGWVFTLLRNGEIGGESMFWSQQSISTLINPPFALSILLIFIGLYIILKGLRTENKKLLILATFIFGVLIQVKVYAAILVLSGLLSAGIWRMFKRKGIALIKVFTGSLILSVLLFSPVTRSVDKTLIFSPFWFLETMMGLSDRFGWERFYSAMTNYRLSGNWIKSGLAYTFAFIIFWVGNMGTRIIKEVLVLKWFRSFKKLRWVEVFIASIVVMGGVLPMLFLQPGTPWNTIQFMYYSLLFSGILAGVVFGEFVENSRLNTAVLYSIGAIVVLITIPTTIGTLGHYLPSRPPAKISKVELEALEFLSKQPNGVVLTMPFDKEAADAAVANLPRPLYLYESTAYVSAFGNKQVFLEDEVNLNITGYDWRVRRNKIEEFYKSLDQEFVRSFLKKNNIEYIYWLKGQRTVLGESQLDLVKIFENNEVKIFKTE